MKGSTPSPHAEIDRLIAASHEGQLTYADRDRLERLLQEAGARQRYRAVSMLHASLVYLWHHQPGEQADDGPDRGPFAVAGVPLGSVGGRRRDRPGRRSPAAFGEAVWRLLGPLARPTPFSLAIAAITIGGILAATAAMRLSVSSGIGPAASQVRRPAVASVAAVHQAVWQSPAGPRQPVDAFEPGDFLLGDDRLHLASGMIELAFFGGGRLVVEGPAEIVLTARDAVRLEAGRIVVRTTHGPRGGSATPLFTVATPRGYVDDLGTEFGVEVPAAGQGAGADIVHVFEGVVDVRTPVTAVPRSTGLGSAERVSAAEPAAQMTLRLSAGDSARVGSSRGPEMLASHASVPQFRRRLPDGIPTVSAGRRGIAVRRIVIDDAALDGVQTFTPPSGSVAYRPGSDRGGQDSREVTSLRRVTDGRYQWWDRVRDRVIVAYAPEAVGRFQIRVSWGAGWATHGRDARYVLDHDGDPATTGDQTPLATIDQRLFADGSGEPPANQPAWSGFRDLGIHDIGPATRLLLLAGTADASVTADAVLFVEQSAAGGADGKK